MRQYGPIKWRGYFQGVCPSSRQRRRPCLLFLDLLQVRMERLRARKRRVRTERGLRHEHYLQGRAQRDCIIGYRYPFTQPRRVRCQALNENCAKDFKEEMYLENKQYENQSIKGLVACA